MQAFPSRYNRQMPVKLIALDIDGTLLDSRWQVSEANRKAIAEAARRGIEVALVTGRRYDFAMPIARELDALLTPLNLTMIVISAPRIFSTAWTSLTQHASQMTSAFGAGRIADGSLGLVQGLNKHSREARDTLRRAAGLARRQGDVALAQQIESMRQDIDNPLLHLALRMGPLLGDDDLDDDFDLF